jgi:hypothetical protein
MQALQAFANNPEAKRLAHWTNGEWANNPEVRRWEELSRNMQAIYPSLFTPRQ